jgi:hypothetical protein
MVFEAVVNYCERTMTKQMLRDWFALWVKNAIRNLKNDIESDLDVKAKMYVKPS